MRALAAASVWCALAGPGCAWIFQDHLSGAYTPDPSLPCTTSPAWWIADGVLALADAAATILDASVAHRTEDDNAALAVAGIGVAAHAASAVTGALWASTCRTARAPAEPQF